MTKLQEYSLAFLRITLGLIFLWAFFDKLFGLGFSTTPDKSWLAGVSPTSGFLSFAAKGPLAPVFNAMAGCIFVDWLFMLGLLLIGVSLVLGICRKISGYSGAVMMLLMWLAVLPPEHHPFLDEHIIYLLVLIGLANIRTKFSLSKWWSSTRIVKKFPFLE
jgi:thiosulfate dehydrogenase [quinone] large subunit